MRALVLAVITSAAVLLAAPGAAQPVETPVPAPLAPAGLVPSTISLDVTGVPVADPVFLDAQIRDALDRAIRPTLRPGSSIAIGPVVPWPLFPLVSGTRAAVNVTVNLAGDASSAPVTAITTVVLNGVVAPAATPSLLFLDDDPEYVLSDGVTFRGTVASGRPARLYYYHSDIGAPRDLDVLLTATSPARVHLIASRGGPDLDVMSVGHVVSRDFLQLIRNDEGLAVDLVPGVPFVVRHALLLQGEVVAGALDVDVVGGGPVGVAVVAAPAGTRPETYLAGPRVPYDGHHRHGTFDLTSYGTRSASFTVGGPPAAVQYGSRTPTPRNVDPADDGRDYGDYGVVQRLTFALDNPSEDPRIVYLYERPLGGPVRSSFLVDGTLRELGCARVAQPYQVASYQLAPHSRGASTTVTMTDGGSFYPVEYGVTDAQPLPTTPPAGTPDSCWPPAAAPAPSPAASAALR